MILAKVIGTVVATRKVDAFEGLKFMIIQPLDEKLRPSGDPLVAADTQQSGPGQIVFYVASREASLPLPDPFNPSDATITGIVDSVDVAGGKG